MLPCRPFGRLHLAKFLDQCHPDKIIQDHVAQRICIHKYQKYFIQNDFQYHGRDHGQHTEQENLPQ